ncbi:MAG TPA: response regulator, partial [Treponemataceae bacterium]|nr:response regulator [Treponemataceae bacterium]
MKQVLLIDESDVFRDYIKDKLSGKNVAVIIGVGPLDSLSKMRTMLPDLVIMAMGPNGKDTLDLLEKKRNDANARDIPTIILAQQVLKGDLTKLSEYGIKKVLPKPIKIDQLFAAITEYIGVDFEIDTTPCILEARVNDNI